MSYFKSGYWQVAYFADYWQELDDGAIATLVVTAGASVAWTGVTIGGQIPLQPDLTIGGGAGKRPAPPLLKPWEAFEPTIIWARATVSGTAHVEADALHDDPVVLVEEIRVEQSNAIDEDDQIVLSFVTAFLCETNNGCEINGIIS